MFRVGRIPYLNCEPFFTHLTGFPTLDLPPRQLGEALALGEADAAALSLVDFLRLEPSLEGLPFGIATDGPARSVILFSDRAPADLEDATISVTDETATSVDILRILLALRYRVTPRAWVGPAGAADAVLLIGDGAIRALTGGLESLPEIAARRRDTGWGPAEITTYLRGFTYRLGPREERAIAEFQRLRGQVS